MYRNWIEICNMSKRNRLLMMLLATIDLESREGGRLASAFTECFATEPVPAPVPLSVLKHESFELHKEEEGTHARDDRLALNDSLTPHNIPHIGFDIYGNNVGGADLPILPDDISPNEPVGTVVDHEGGKWVVVENNDATQELYLAPLECIDVNT